MKPFCCHKINNDKEFFDENCMKCEYHESNGYDDKWLFHRCSYPRNDVCQKKTLAWKLGTLLGKLTCVIIIVVPIFLIIKLIGGL